MRSWKILEAQNFPTPTGPWWKISSSCGKWCGELGIGSLGPCIEPHLHLRRWKHWKLDIKIIKSINRSWLLNDDVSVFNLPRKSVFLWIWMGVDGSWNGFVIFISENQLRGPGSSTSRAWRKLGETEDFGRKHWVTSCKFSGYVHEMFTWNVHVSCISVPSVALIQPIRLLQR